MTDAERAEAAVSLAEQAIQAIRAGRRSTTSAGRPATPLELYRRARGLSRADLAELAGVHAETVGRLERGEHFPHAGTLILLAAALGVEPARLVELQDAA